MQFWDSGWLSPNLRQWIRSSLIVPISPPSSFRTCKMIDGAYSWFSGCEYTSFHPVSQFLCPFVCVLNFFHVAFQEFSLTFWYRLLCYFSSSHPSLQPLCFLHFSDLPVWISSDLFKRLLIRRGISTGFLSQASSLSLRVHRYRLQLNFFSCDNQTS